MGREPGEPIQQIRHTNVGPWYAVHHLPPSAPTTPQRPTGDAAVAARRDAAAWSGKRIPILIPC